MNVLFTICARAGSKGAKGKNVRMFCGQPLVYYTLEIYQKYLKKHGGGQDKIDLAVNTDSGQLLQQIRDKGTAFVFIERIKALAEDTAAKPDVIRDTWKKVEEMRDCKYDLVIDLDLTSPLRNLEDVERTASLVLENEKCNYAYSVTEARRNPYFNMVCRKENGFYDTVIQSDYTARQQAPVCCDMNASIYAYAREYLMNMRVENRFALVWKMADSLVLDIDSDDDFEMMEMLTQYYWKHGRYMDIRE